MSDTPPATPPAQPAPYPTANGNEHVPYVRFKEVNDQLAAAQRQLTEQGSAHAAALATAQREAREAAQRATNAERNAVLVGTGIKAGSVQRALRRGYDDYAGEAGDKALPFDEWIDKEAKADPLFAPHFAAPPPVAPPPGQPVVPPVATPPAAPPVPASNPLAGAQPPPSPGAGRRFTDEEVNRMSDAEYRANKHIIEAQLVEEGRMAPPKKKPATA